jgi:hypothetical protein
MASGKKQATQQDETWWEIEKKTGYFFIAILCTEGKHIL